MNSTEIRQLITNEMERQQHDHTSSQEFINDLIQDSQGNDEHPYLQNKTKPMLKHEIMKSITTYATHVYQTENELTNIIDSLDEFRWAPTTNEIMMGKFTKCIRIKHSIKDNCQLLAEKQTVKNYQVICGFVTRIIQRNSGVFVLMINRGKVIHCCFDNFLWYQQLTHNENLFLIMNKFCSIEN